MKITHCIALVLFFVTSAMSGQDIANHAFGLRLGESDGYGAELSYQKSIGRYGRMELNAVIAPVENSERSKRLFYTRTFFR